MHSIRTNEDLRNFVMEHGLPATEIGLFGVKCPYCGKSDQIRKLESPDDLKDLVEEKELAAYSAFLKVILPPDRSIGVCRFCRNCLILNGNGQAEPIEERL
ncbi:MAG: hypothetical protein LJE96_08185 [Deltaproteobacteria bacterium]|nr:hypothetical protein [Deltaproteobacteria bacterium]